MKPSGVPLDSYERACSAIAAAAQVDQVKDIRDQAKALRLYARQALGRLDVSFVLDWKSQQTVLPVSISSLPPGIEPSPARESTVGRAKVCA
jgi:hypothetical protein